MSTVQWSGQARRAFHRYRRDDPQGTDQVLDAVNLLAKDPEPTGAQAYGNGTFRIHVGTYRVMYTVRQRTPLVLSVDVLGRSPLG